MIKTLRYFFFLFLLIFFSSCSSTQDELKKVFQTNSAELISNDQKKIQQLLVKFKKKLDKRNPKNFNKKNEQKIYAVIKNFNKKLYLKYQNRVIKEYKDFLNLAFLKDKILNRNDYLILGINYMVAYAYDTEEFHNITAFQFDKEKLAKLHKNLQILRWKIKVNRDINNNYLFLTWQNNWQVELEKKLRKVDTLQYEDIKKLKSIETKKESLFSHSNFSFEILLTQMIDSVENSLKALGEEPTDLGISAVKFFIFL